MPLLEWTQTRWPESEKLIPGGGIPHRMWCPTDADAEEHVQALTSPEAAEMGFCDVTLDGVPATPVNALEVSGE